MKHTKWMILSLVVLALLGFLTTMIRTGTSSQAISAIVFPIDFEGEYSLDGSPWQELTPGSRIPANGGDLRLRGHFDVEYPLNEALFLYLDHLDMTMKINGEEIINTFKPTEKISADFCGTYWYNHRISGVTREDDVEILLHSAHKFGNGDGYREFIDRIYCAPEYYVKDFLLKEGRIQRVAALAVTILSLVVLGFALAFAFIGVEASGRMTLFGLSTLLMCGYLAMDTPDVFLWSEQILFNTSISHISMMLAALGLSLFSLEYIREKRLAWVGVTLLGLFDGTLILLSASGKIRICATLMPWAIVQGIVCVILLAFLCRKLFNTKFSIEYSFEFACALMLLLILIDLCGVIMGWSLQGVCSKTGFMIILLVFLLWTMRKFPENYRQAMRAKQLEGELEESRIAVMVSQIHPHFLFNALSTIRHLCRTQPDQAWEALGDFSSYLRANTDALTTTKLIPFSQELRHIQSYLKLEKLRFGDRLDIVYDIEEEDFLLPPLTVQPLVENAVKHGIFYAKNGGTVCIETRKTGGVIEIVIRDDGVGFDVDEQVDANDRVHVGIRNVQTRLGKLIHARMSVESRRNEGTTVTIHIG